MAKRKTFWTPKRLIELRAKSKKMTLPELCHHFQRPDYEITQALLYEQNKRKLFIEKRIELIGKKHIVVTILAAEFAQGARDLPNKWLPTSYL